MSHFDYDQAFIRNLGWLTREEQQKIKKSKIAIIGMGGVGGHHAHCLARIGFSRFKISDLDFFELQNFNRQFEANISNLNKDKTQVIAEAIKDINPEAEIERFNEGINLENMDEFLNDVDVICDGLDLYASDLRSPLYELAHKKGVYVVSAGPFGMGTSVMAFSPQKMSFNQYFDLDKPGLTVEAKIIRFLMGMAPTLMHRKYVASPDDVDLFGGKLPSIHAGCYSASAALASTVVKIVLKRGKVLYAPWSYHTDFCI
jgi:molybdopterin/thiamine biosynthesis adenylyltransferase